MKTLKNIMYFIIGAYLLFVPVMIFTCLSRQTEPKFAVLVETIGYTLGFALYFVYHYQAYVRDKFSER